MAAGQIHGFILQDAPGRSNLDGFPDYSMPDPMRVVKIAKLISEKSLIGIGLNHEGLSTREIEKSKAKLSRKFNVPVEDPVIDGVKKLADSIESLGKQGIP